MKHVFRTNSDDMKHRNGQFVDVVGRTPYERFNPAEIDENTAPMIVVRFPDGIEHDVYQDEVREVTE